MQQKVQHRPQQLHLPQQILQQVSQKNYSNSNSLWFAGDCVSKLTLW